MIDPLEEESYDIYIINGLRHEKKFCLDLERTLVQFIKDANM